MGRGELPPLPLVPDRRAQLAHQPAARDGNGDAGAYLEGAALLDADPGRRAPGDPARALRGVERRRRERLAEVQVRHLAVAAHALPYVYAIEPHLDARRLQQRLPAYRRPARRQDAR